MDAAARVARVAAARIAEGALNGRTVDDLADELKSLAGNCDVSLNARLAYRLLH